MATASIIATNCGALYTINTTYATARNATTAGAISTTSLYIGQRWDTAEHFVSRTFAAFVIPGMTAISAASLFLYGKQDVSTVDFNMYLHTSAHSNPLVVADIDQFTGWKASGAYDGTVLNNDWNSSSYSATWNEIVLNASGLAAVLAKSADTLKLVALSKEDYDSSSPSDMEYCYFEPPTTSGKEPYLAITYTPIQSVVPLTMDSYRRRRI